MYGGKEEGGGSLQEGKDICRMKKFLKIGSQPINIAYPLPLTSFFAFSFSNSGIFEFVISYFFCFFFFTATNLWNHINDAEDDARDGKEDSVFLLENRREATFLVLLFYVVSALILPLTKDTLAVLMFFICLVLTWIYSDKILIGKKIRRLKEDYRTEILTYLIVTPSFALLIWTFFSPIDIRGFSFALIVSSLYISGVLLKDIKDYSADSLAGYKTLAVVISPLKLFILSFSVFFIAIFLVLILSVLGLIPRALVLTSTILIPLTYSILSIRKAKWEISLKTIKNIRLYTLCYPTTILLMGILSLFKV